MYEFFCGGGMVRAALGDEWNCLFANDFDRMKAEAYRENWGKDDILCDDVRRVVPTQLPGMADLAWASFPCQDLSLAGNQHGLTGTRSGCFWPFWNLMRALRAEGRGPRTVILENVYGALTSRGGIDFATICAALASGGYHFGAAVVDARLFLPQSRPRLFIVGVRDDLSGFIPASVRSDGPIAAWHPAAMLSTEALMDDEVLARRLWWNLPAPPERKLRLADIIEEDPHGVEWHTRAQTEKLLGMMTEVNRAKVRDCRKAGGCHAGTIYKRTRPDADGTKQQRAEVRFDDVAGCLRTPAGGSSRQIVIVVENGRVRTRLMSPREAARLMGLPDAYRLPARYNDAYHLAGDGVAVPVVRHIVHHIVSPILDRADAALALEGAA
jgi:DNA (cytosine-5)-methyltransferase 1